MLKLSKQFKSKQAIENWTGNFEKFLETAKRYENWVMDENGYFYKVIKQTKTGLIVTLQVETNSELKKAVAQALYPEIFQKQEIANKLAKSINQAIENNEGDDLIIVKSKMSRSKWYDYTGELNSRSQYFYKIPRSTEADWKKLYHIKKSFQGNRIFDFYACEVNYIIEREADH